MLINFLLIVGLLIIVSLGYAGVKFFIHNFINFPYNGQLWIYYAIFYFSFFSFFAILSSLLKTNLFYNSTFFFILFIFEGFVFFAAYYWRFSFKKYFKFLFFSSVIGIPLVALTLITASMSLSALWKILELLLNATWF